MEAFSENIYQNQAFKNVRYEKKEIKYITFQDCTFENCSFRESILKSCAFQNCTFKRCDLSLVDVDGSSFTMTKFEDSKAIGVNWVKASWGKKDVHQLLKSIDFTKCVINYSTFMGLILEKITLKHCVAKEVDFSETNLKQADCTYTDFSNSQFRKTNLTEADFTGATNYVIVPHLNTLKKTKFSLPEAMSLLYNMDIILTDTYGDRGSETGENFLEGK